MQKKVAIFAIIFIFLIKIIFPQFFPFSSFFKGFFPERGRVLGVSERFEADTTHAVAENVVAAPAVNETEAVKPIMAEPVKKSDFSDFSLNDCSGAVLDSESGEILFEDGADTKVPIASITKLATALTFLDFNPGWEREQLIVASDLVQGGRIYFRVGEKLKIWDLFHLSLVASDNSATKALARSAGLSESVFISKMNEKMTSLGLRRTSFVEPVGLSNKNVSTAREVAQLARAAFEKKEIKEATVMKDYSGKTVGGRLITVNSTDRLLKKYSNQEVKIYGGKTGFTNSAGYCFVGGFENKDGKKLISVVLGGKDNNSRFQNTEKLIAWAYQNYSWE